MKAVVMAGGFGTRLRPLTCNVPKPLVPIGNKPVMEHVVNLLRDYGFEEITVLLYYQPEVIKKYFKSGKQFGVKFNYVTLFADLGTAGAVNYGVGKGKETTLVISADIMTNFNLGKIVEFHKKRKARATITLTRVKDPLSYGIVITDKRGQIQRFLEKPSWSEVFSDTVNTGIYLLEPEAFSHIPQETEFDFSKDLFPRMLQAEDPLYGHICEGYWRDIGNLTEYRLAHLDLLRGEIEVDISGQRTGALWVDKGCRIDKNVLLEEGNIIGANCRIEEGVKISNCCLGRGCVIGKGTTITNSILWDGVTVGNKAEIGGSIIGAKTEIGDRAFLQDGVTISDSCYIGQESRIRTNVKVWPFKKVEDGATLSSSLIWTKSFSRGLFGTHGVVGLANVEISPEFACKLGAAYAATFPKRTLLCTSRDNEKVCRMINRAIMTGILSVGSEVADARTIPIPVARYQLKTSSHEKGGLHTKRAPHDPGLIEIHFFDENGLDIPVTKEKAIEQMFFREDFKRATVAETGTLSFPYRVVDFYKEGFLKEIDKEVIKKRGFKIVVDYGFGDAVPIFPSILGELNCNVVALNAHLDESKITKTQKEVGEALGQLSDIVATLGADIGFMFDVEAEQLFLVSEKGRVIPDSLALLAVASLVSKVDKKAKIAVHGMVTRVAEEIIPAVKRIKGTSRALMEEREVALVGNGRGGFIFPAFQPAFDAMFASVKILELLAKTGLSLEKVAGEIPPFYQYHERVPCPWEEKGATMRRLIEITKKEKVDLTDGIKVYHRKDWALMIPSTNRSLFHIFTEAGSEKEARALAEKYAGIISKP